MLAQLMLLSLRETIGVQYTFQAYSPMIRPLLGTRLWKFGNSTVVFLFQALADDDVEDCRIMSAYGFYSFFFKASRDARFAIVHANAAIATRIYG